MFTSTAPAAGTGLGTTESAVGGNSLACTDFAHGGGLTTLLVTGLATISGATGDRRCIRMWRARRGHVACAITAAGATRCFPRMHTRIPSQTEFHHRRELFSVY